ncbi:MAG: L,D-transpeptidase family protein [Eggerthellaceae bacterium]|nr:L,D-transpeptidase family protein [Eggerthellaceae bacterium]
MAEISRRKFVAAAAGALAVATLPGCAAGSSSASAASGSASATSASSSASSSAAATGTGDGLHASTQPEKASPDWLSALDAAKNQNTKQLFVVAGLAMDKTSASVSMHERAADGTWRQILSTPGLIGKLGMCADADHKEGVSQTPIGTYGFNKAFGIADDPGCALPYTKVTEDTYWSGDQRPGMHYNEMVDIKDYPDLNKEDSEHIFDYEYEYQYCLNISFNDNATPDKGSAIFLHCLGTVKPYTGGCVAVPENKMKQIMQRVDPDCVVVIDTVDALGVTF